MTTAERVRNIQDAHNGLRYLYTLAKHKQITFPLTIDDLMMLLDETSKKLDDEREAEPNDVRAGDRVYVEAYVESISQDPNGRSIYHVMTGSGRLAARRIQMILPGENAPSVR